MPSEKFHIFLFSQILVLLTIHCRFRFIQKEDYFLRIQKVFDRNIIRSANRVLTKEHVNLFKANTAEEVGNPRMTDFLIFIRVYLQK